MAAAINDYYKKIVTECSETQENGISNYNFQTIDTSVLLNSGLLNNSTNISSNNNSSNGSTNGNDDDCKITSFNDCGALWTSFMGSMPGLPTSLDGSLTLPILGSSADTMTCSSSLPPGGSLPMSMTDPLSLAAIGSLHTTNIINIEDNIGDIIDVNSCCMCNVCSAMFRNNAELVEHLKTHLLKEEKEGFMCILCGNEYRHKYNLKRHLKKVHQIAHDLLHRYVDTEVVPETIGGQFLAPGVEMKGESSTFYQSVMDIPTPKEQISVGDNHDNDDNGNTSIINISEGENLVCGSNNLIITSNTNNIYLMNKNINIVNSDINNNCNISSKFNNSNSNKNSKNSNSNIASTTTSSTTTTLNSNFDKAPCYLCGRVLSNKWSLKRHLHLVHKLDKDADEPPPKKQPKNSDSCEPSPLVCPVCQKQFLDNGVYDADMRNAAAVALQAHLDQCHPLSLPVDSDISKLSTPVVNSAVFSDIDDTAISMLKVFQ